MDSTGFIETVHFPTVEVEDIPMEEVIGDKETAQAGTQATPVEYGRGMRIRTKPISYEPAMTGKLYTIQQRFNNLCYRGNRYMMDEIVPSGTILYKLGVIHLNMDTLV
jgi:hypothetical protein